MSSKTFIISRTDSIGDVVLTLPMAGAIKKQHPQSKVVFLGRTYTKAVVELSTHVDEFLNWDELKLDQNKLQTLINIGADAIIHVFPNNEIATLAKKAAIPLRIGTFGRRFHLLNCNKKVKFSRKKSDLHEAQLNFNLLKPLGIANIPDINTLIDLYGLKVNKELSPEFKRLIDSDRFNIILHPKSQGSAKEWGLNNFNQLIEKLPESKYKIFISGTEEEKKLIGDRLNFNKTNVVSLLGKLSLEEFIAFINEVDGLVAASTGPLHIASALSKKAIGLYSPLRPIHPGRWRPLGENVHALVFNEDCEQCKQGSPNCNCISQISAEKIVNLIQ